MKIIIEGEDDDPGVVAAIAAMLIFDLNSRAGADAMVKLDYVEPDLKKKLKASSAKLEEYNGAGTIEEDISIKVSLRVRSECPACKTRCGWEATANDIARCRKK